MKFRKYILTSLLIIVALSFVIAINTYINYVYNLECQIYERDKLINQLTYSDKLVKDYFKIETDSTGKCIAYVLKEEKTKRHYRRGNEILSEKELLDFVNQQNFKYNDFVNEYNNLVDDYNAILDQYDSLRIDYDQLVKMYNRQNRDFVLAKDSVKMMTIALHLMENGYDIGYETMDDSLTCKVKIINTSRLDSALMLLPYFRENLLYDEKENKWFVKPKK